MKLREIERDDVGVITIEKPKAATKQPPMYDVLIHNDDYTHAEFVIDVLQKFFEKSLQGAIQFMLHVHKSGMGVIGTYPKDVAETKAQAAMNYARAHEHPLYLTVEPRG